MEIINKTTKEKFEVDAQSLIGKSTKSIYIRKGRLNGTLFLSQRGNGSEGAGDICRLDAESVEVNESLYSRLLILAEK